MRRICYLFIVFQTGIIYEEEYDETAEGEVKQYIEETNAAKDVSYHSKIEQMKGVKKAQGNMMDVGIGIIAIPWKMVIIAVVVLVAICVEISLITYRNSVKRHSIVERIRCIE
ncbi:MAG: hypothetical protein PHW34_00735 [Hespellia sp.]|nr:hypothetical protein [Hespellia sp.]